MINMYDPRTVLLPIVPRNDLLLLEVLQKQTILKQGQIQRQDQGPILLEQGLIQPAVAETLDPHKTKVNNKIQIIGVLFHEGIRMKCQ